MLERLAGHWTWTGQQANIGAENSPYGQGGRIVGSGDGRLIMDGQFILDKYQETSPEGNLMHGISLINYDPAKKCFVARDCMSDGATSISEFTIDGRVRKEHITITSRTGEILLARVVGEYSRDWKRQEQTWEGSTDNGASWKHWATAVFEKPDGPVSDEQELIRLATAWENCLVTRDVATLDRLWAEEYTSGTPDGKVRSKKQELAEIQSDDHKIVAATCEDLQARVYGDTGVTTGIAVEKGYYKDVDISGRYRFTDTWVKRDGRWQCVATHASKVAAGGDEQSLEGVWVAQEQKFAGSVQNLEGKRHSKTFQDGQWCAVSHDASTGEVETVLGGAYTFDGKMLKETIAYVNVDEALQYVGATFTYDIRFENGRFYQSGDVFGQRLEEIWSRATAP